MNKPLKPQARQAAANGGLRLPQVEPVRLYRQIAALISDRIDKGAFPVGSLLPAERDLAEQLGVSRTSVREALIALEVSGKVSIRVGHGVQILQATPRSDGVGADAEVSEGDIGPIQMMEARRLIEPRSAELAAVNRDSANLERIERALEEQARAEVGAVGRVPRLGPDLPSSRSRRPAATPHSRSSSELFGTIDASRCSRRSRSCSWVRTAFTKRRPSTGASSRRSPRATGLRPATR